MSDPGQGTLHEIYTAMKEIEQAYIPGAVGEPDFVAYDYMPTGSTLPYPFSMRMDPIAKVDWRRMNQGSENPLSYVIPVIVLVSRSSNDQGALIREAERYVLPMIGLYFANPYIKKTVRMLRMDDIIMGDLTINGVKHYGVQFPIIIEQSKVLPVAPRYEPTP